MVKSTVLLALAACATGLLVPQGEGLQAMIAAADDADAYDFKFDKVRLNPKGYKREPVRNQRMFGSHLGRFGEQLDQLIGFGSDDDYSSQDGLDDLNDLGLKQAYSESEDPLISAPIDKSTLDSWLHDQYIVAWQNLLKNIGNSSYCTDEDLLPGVIVASPSKIAPNYYYQWTRDSALTIRTLIHYLQDFQLNNTEYQLLVEQYIWNNYHLQRLPNNSGQFKYGNDGGLGEPKFLVDNSQFNLNWGRPQNDGPGLRVTSIINFLDLHPNFLTNLNETFIYHEIIKPDLIYVLNNWAKSSFDLWEEINSLHFFTSNVQLKGLFDGLKFAEKLENSTDPAFLQDLRKGYNNLKAFIEDFYVTPKTNYVIESPQLFPHKRSGLDAAVLLGSIHSHDMNEYDDFIPFNINHNSIINHLVALINDMKTRYPINKNYINNNWVAVGLGRYPEDVYDGYATSEGNPWFISTATAAELIFKLVYKLSQDKKDLVITNNNKEFYSLVINSDELNADFTILPYESKEFKQLLKGLLHLSDSFLLIVKNHVDASGGISEQFNKYHGFMQGARDLTWSYSALLNAIRWRSKVLDLLD